MAGPGALPVELAAAQVQGEVEPQAAAARRTLGVTAALEVGPQMMGRGAALRAQ